MTRRRRIWAWIGISVAALLLFLATVTIVVVRSPWFSDYVRRKIISTVEESTGGNVEIGSFHFKWTRLQATVQNLVLHGTERSNEAPLFRADRIEVRLKLLAGLRHAVDLDYLGVDRPSANLIVYPDGRTNVPRPKVVTKSKESALATVVDLAIHRFDVSNGTVIFRQQTSVEPQAAAFSGHGENLQAQLQYHALPAAGYQGDIKIGSLLLATLHGHPLNASVDLPLEIRKDSIEFRNAAIATKESRVNLTASVAHLGGDPGALTDIRTNLTAHISLREVQGAANLEMDACGRNTPCFADAGISASVRGHTIQISSANLRIGGSALDATGTTDRAQWNGKVDLAEIGRLFRVAAKPRGEMMIQGTAQTRGDGAYAIAGNVTGRGIGAGATRIDRVVLSTELEISRNQIEAKVLRIGALGGEFDGQASLSEFSRFRVDGRLRNFNIRELERQLLGQSAGYDGTIAGEVESSGDLKAQGASGLRTQVQLSIAPGSGGVPVSGRIQASYDGARNAVSLGQSILRLPHSRLDAKGTLGSLMNVDFTSTDTRDFDPAVAIISSSRPAAMPVRLNGGKIALHARVAGPHADPVITGQLDAERFVVTGRSFDRLSAAFSASASHADVQNGVLSRPGVGASFSGSIGLRQWKPAMDSPLAVAAAMTHGDIADILALAGQSDIPGRGTLDVSAQIHGVVGNPQGSIQITAANGAFYDEPFDTIDARVDLADQLIRLATLQITASSASIQANGAYTHPRNNLLSGQVQFHVASSGVQLENIPRLAKYRAGIGGTVQLSGDTRGAVSDANGSTSVALTAIQADVAVRGLRDRQQNFGDLTAHADTSGSNVNFHADSGFSGSTIRVSGRTTLETNYPTSAAVSIQNLPIESVLAFANRSFPAKGIAGLTGHVSGTLKDPSADAQITLAKATIYNEPIDSFQASVRYSSQLAQIDSLRLAAPAGILDLNASFSHPAGRFDRGRIQIHAESGSLRLAQIHAIQDQKPGLGGAIALLADFTGDLNAGPAGRDIAVSRLNANVTATGLVYNGHSLGEAKILATANGNDITFRADSNFAGSAIHGDGDVRPQGDYPMRAKLTVANVRYSNVRSLLGGDSIRPGFDALLEADGSIAGPAGRPENLSGSLNINRLELSVPAGNQDAPAASGLAPGSASAPAVIAIKNEGPVVLAYERSRLTVKTAHLTGSSTNISVAGSVGLAGTRPLDVKIQANADLGVIQQIERDVHSSGTVSVDAALRGNLSQPVANGTIQLKNASINVESLPNGISNANGVIALNGTSLSIRNLTAESAGGKITLSGFAALTGSASRYSLNAKVDHVRTRYQGISVVNDATLSLTGTNARSLLSGTVTVQRLAFNPQSDIGSILSEITGGAAPNVSTNLNGPLATMRLDVRIRTAPGVRFETTLAEQLQADADLNLVGTVEQPGMVGRVNITQGDLIFFKNEYSVSRSTINFYNPSMIDPRLDIGLETTVESIAVTLRVSGPMNNLKISYQSDPPLEFQDIVGLLVSGKRPSSDPNIVATQPPSPQQSLGQMGETAVVSQAVAAPLSQQLQRIFGVNQLRIDPTFASGSALPQTRLSLQQRVASTLTFTYTQDLTQSNSELVRVEWAVSPRFSAVATRDENGIFGMDFFYKRQFQ